MKTTYNVLILTAVAWSGYVTAAPIIPGSPGPVVPAVPTPIVPAVPTPHIPGTLAPGLPGSPSLDGADPRALRFGYDFDYNKKNELASDKMDPNILDSKTSDPKTIIPTTFDPSKFDPKTFNPNKLISSILGQSSSEGNAQIGERAVDPAIADLIPPEPVSSGLDPSKIPTADPKAMKFAYDFDYNKKDEANMMDSAMMDPKEVDDERAMPESMNALTGRG